MSEALFNERVVVCPKCEGVGGKHRRIPWHILLAGVILGPPVEIRWVPCEVCHGNGYVLRKDEAA